MLLFKKKFLDAIRRGEKTQTIRLWVRPRLQAGQRSYIPGVGYIWVRSVAPVALAELTDADAIPDGFPTADALREEIRTIYAQYPDRGQRPYRILFELAPGEQKKPPRVAPRAAIEPAAGQAKPVERRKPADPRKLEDRRPTVPKPAQPIPAQPLPARSSCAAPVSPVAPSAVTRMVLPADGFPVPHRRSS